MTDAVTQETPKQEQFVLLYDVDASQPTPDVPRLLVASTMLANPNDPASDALGVVITHNEAAVASLKQGGRAGFTAAVEQASALLESFPGMVQGLYGDDVFRLAMLRVARSIGITF